MPPHSRPRPVFVGKALPQWRDDALFLRAAVKFQPRSWVFPNLPSPFDLQLFRQDLFDTAWLRGKRLPTGPWPKGSVLPLHPPEAAAGQFWVACPKDPVQHMQAMSGTQHPANMLLSLGRFLEEAVDFVATCSTHDALSSCDAPRSVLCCSSTPCSQLVIRTQPSLTSLLPASQAT